MALLILALLQRIFLMSSLMLLLVWLIFFMVLIKLLPILGTISGKTDRKSGSAGMPRPISYAVFFLKKKNNIWRLKQNLDGYGRIKINGRFLPVRGNGYKLYSGKSMPKGIHVLHTCEMSY